MRSALLTACCALALLASTVQAHAAPKAKPSAKPPVAMEAADDATCTPQVTHRLDADLWWAPAPATSGTSTLIGYRIQRQVNEQRQWQDVAAVAADVVRYVIDGVTPVVKPGNTYRYRVLALWQPSSGAVLASEAGEHGAQVPCLQILPLPPPGMLQATPKS